jgi:hypothetical protein
MIGTCPPAAPLRGIFSQPGLGWPCPFCQGGRGGGAPPLMPAGSGNDSSPSQQGEVGCHAHAHAIAHHLGQRGGWVVALP